MTIKENMKLINDTLNHTYTTLQDLSYEPVIETFIRLKLLDIMNISRELFEFIHSQEKRQRQSKNKLKRG